MSFFFRSLCRNITAVLFFVFLVSLALQSKTTGAIVDANMKTGMSISNGVALRTELGTGPVSQVRVKWLRGLRSQTQIQLHDHRQTCLSYDNKGNVFTEDCLVARFWSLSDKKILTSDGRCLATAGGSMRNGARFLVHKCSNKDRDFNNLRFQPYALA